MKRNGLCSASLSALVVALVLVGPIQAVECRDFSFKWGGSERLPPDWKELTFPNIGRHTSYTIERAGKDFWIKAESRESASALVRQIQIDPRVYPILRWRWRVENILQKGDARKKAGDDYPARVYANFLYDPNKASLWEKAQYGLPRSIYGEYPPKAALNYIWANKIKRGEVLDSPYTARAKLIAIQSGPEKIGRWVSEERNIYQDYISYFGEEPPEVTAIAIMTDTDNTGEDAIAYYADITLCPE
ncbi:MAG: DUF3047 domain-containing protein [Gammaproteobacteria bacterium]